MATQAHRGPRFQGSDHGSKSQRASTENRAGERHLPPHSDSTRTGTHHIVKRPNQAGRRVPARGPSHLHPTWGNNLNPATTCRYVEMVRGVAPTSGLPTMATGPPHNTRYILLPRAAPVLSRSSTHSTHHAAQHPPRGAAARSYPTTDNTRHNPHPCAPCVAKGTQHTRQRREGEDRGFVLRSPKEGLSPGIWRRKVVMCPRRGNDPTSGHPRAHQPPLGRGTSPPGWDGHLDALGQRRRQLPSSVWSRCREVKRGKSGGSVGTTDQGNGKGRSGERPMGTTAYGGNGQGQGKGSREGRLG